MTPAEIAAENKWWEMEKEALEQEAKAAAEEEARYNDPAFALAFITKEIVTMNEGCDEPMEVPVAVETLHAAIGSRGIDLIFKGTRANGTTDYLCYESWYDPGNYECPPDGGGECFWLTDLTGKARKEAEVSIATTLFPPEPKGTYRRSILDARP